MTRQRTPKASRRRQSLISFLSGVFLPPAVAKPQRRRGRRTYGGMRFEALEDRRMLAHVTLNEGILRIADITGGNTNDQLTISHSNGSYSISDAILSMTTDIPGATGAGTSTLVVPDSGIQGIEFDTRGGNDVFNIDTLPALTVPLVIPRSEKFCIENLDAGAVQEKQ